MQGRVSAGAWEVSGPRQLVVGDSQFKRSSVTGCRLVGVNIRYGLTEIDHPVRTVLVAG